MRSTRRERGCGTAAVAGRARSGAGWYCALGCLAVLALAAGVGLLRGNAQQAAFQLPSIDPPRAKPAATTSESNPKPSDTGAVSSDPTKEPLQKQCSDLLKMATELKVEVDKTSKDTLSVTVVRKADQIEQYARKVRLGDGKG